MSEQKHFVTVDGNDAVAHIAYRVSEVCSIYPITPSSPMAESADVWSAKGVKNIWGQVPDVFEMQSEGGAAGTAHGALQAGALTTTFTSSQGLLLMLPNMYKIAGELTSTVFHVAARALAAQALSIFGDHQDVMSARMTGFAMLASSSVQEAHDMALISHAATLKARIPFMHFFDGFRTSHEVNKMELLSDDLIRAMIDDDLVYAHRRRALNPDHPVIRGTAQNPDVYFQGRESSNPYYLATPGIVQEYMDRFAGLTGRRYRLVEYYGDEQAEQLLVIIGSGAEPAMETVEYLNAQGGRYGVIHLRLYRPFPAAQLVELMRHGVRGIAVLDRTKEPGCGGEPLYQDVVTALAEAFTEGRLERMPRVIGGRYGLSSKEFTPSMVKGVCDELLKERPKNHFTIGIHDDVTQTSLEWDPLFDLEKPHMTRALLYGLGSDGTVGANKNSIKIIGENTNLYAQGYFVYDSRKAGSQTVSHLRFGPYPIKAPYLIQTADFVACHQFNFVYKSEVLKNAGEGATFLLNSPHGPETVWEHLPRVMQETIIGRGLKMFVIDATTVARDNGMGRRINTVMQTCFFALSGVLPREEAIDQIKRAIEKTYHRKGPSIIEQNFRAVDASLDHLYPVRIPGVVTSRRELDPVVTADASSFVKQVTAPMLEGKGDDLPVSVIPVDGTYPSGTTKWEKRNLADQVPYWEPDICIQCGNCSFVCPHGVIRSKFYHESLLGDAPGAFQSAPISARGFPETRYTLQIYLEDCTGCGVCIEACPAYSPGDKSVKAINMRPREPMLSAGQANVRHFERLLHADRGKVDFSSVRGVQFLEPLFEFSLACAGCGETAYVKLLTQLFGPRLLVANATGCSSIYGGNLPTTPWTKNSEGRGPAWSNSLFEDNAEFGLGMRISSDHQMAVARGLLQELAPHFGEALVREVLDSPQRMGMELREQRQRVAAIKAGLADIDDPQARNLESVVDHLIRRSVWLVGGDGWAYDIGSAGLDHALASGRDINVLVLDTEVYSNTGGQMSKSTPTAASAKFASAGKRIGKKDLAMQAISYGNVYVARVAMGANPQQTLQAMREAEAYKGPSLILAYSPCIAHGYDLQHGLRQQDLAVSSGYWPLIRFNPERRGAGERPFVLDSPRPRISLMEYAYNEARYKVLLRTNPEEAEYLMNVAQELVNLRWETYEHLAEQEPSDFHPVA
ncbi:MAG: pyruvate:ferredoxin (flavodoxin) oxidoreductase [Candidatus Sedimenticola endophacoides]